MAMATRIYKPFKKPPSRAHNYNALARPNTSHNTSRPPPYRGSRKQPTPGLYRGVQCRYCHRNGHFERECRTKQRDLGTNTRPRGHARIANIEATPDDEKESSSNLQLFAATIGMKPQPADDEWYFDTGATHHMTFNKQWLSNYKTLVQSLEVRLVDDSIRYARGFGSLTIQLPDGHTTKIEKVYYVPGLTKNLLSVRAATRNGSTIEFHHDHCVFKLTLDSRQQIRVTCHQRGCLYPLGITTGPAHACTTVTQTTPQLETLKWHYRLGHPNIQVLKTMQQHHMVHGLHCEITPLELCEGCLFGKFKQTRFQRTRSKTSQPLQLVHSDLCGPMPTRSLIVALLIS